MIKTLSHQEYLHEKLKNPTEAAAYLNSITQDGSLKFILKAIRNIVDAQGGIGKLSRKTKLGRTSLYKTLSSSGNPEVGSLQVILAAFGVRIGFLPVAPGRPSRAI